MLDSDSVSPHRFGRGGSMSPSTDLSDEGGGAFAFPPLTHRRRGDREQLLRPWMPGISPEHSPQHPVPATRILGTVVNSAGRQPAPRYESPKHGGSGGNKDQERGGHRLAAEERNLGHDERDHDQVQAGAEALVGE
jgi:hypothetical protein